MEERIISEEKALQIIREVDENGFFERKSGDESFRVEQENENYKVTVFDSETDKNSEGKIYYHDHPGLKEYLTAMITEPTSILNRLS